MIVGAGIAGLACADALIAAGHGAVLFDKGRRPGGRMSTRRINTGAGDDPVQFDHGAQYFTARDPAFRAQVSAWETAGVAARWPAPGDDAWVGTPGMDAPVAGLAANHRVGWDTRVDTLDFDGSGWRAGGTDDPRRFDAAVVAVPAEQAAPLLAPHDLAFAAAADATPSAPCWTAMAAFAARVDCQDDIMKDDGAIGWASRDSAKPGRGETETWVIQASPGWSTQHLENDADDVAPALLALFAARLGTALPPTTYLRAHRWRYARSGGRDGPGALWEPTIRLGACGDWLASPRVEAAWLSGRQLATAMLAHT